MLEIIECKTRADMRAFFRAAKLSGYTRKEKSYLKRYAVFPLSLLSQNGPQAYLVAKREGKPVFRAITGVDERFNRIDGGKTGYFSLFDGEKDSDAQKAILDAIVNLQRAWGMDKVIGPISPDGSGFFMGAGEGDFSKPRGAFTGPDASFSCGVLKACGFLEVQTENAYEIDTGNENPLSVVTRKAEKRFSVEIAPMNPGVFSDRWMKAILSVSKDAPQKEMRLLLERIRPFIDKRYSYIALTGGEASGYLVSLKRMGGVLRATTLITSSDHFSAPVVLSLIERFLRDARKRGVRYAEVSVINHANIRSARLILRFGGKKTRTYTLFTKNVGQN